MEGRWAGAAFQIGYEAKGGMIAAARLSGQAQCALPGG
jgi:hypothetical protein